MKKYTKELIVLFVQLFMFYVFPLFMYLYEPMGIVFIILLMTFILSIIFSIVSQKKIKYLFPFTISILFVPSVYIYYNESALVHSIWYLITSLLGIFIGNIVNLLKKEGK